MQGVVALPLLDVALLFYSSKKKVAQLGITVLKYIK